MAQSIKFHGKYKGVIVSRTDVKKLRDKLELGRGKLIDLLVKNMCYIGETCIKIARETGDYNEQKSWNNWWKWNRKNHTVALT